MIRAYFDLDRHETTVGQELWAGLTTFITMAYIIIVNPKILEVAGIPFGPSMVATIVSAFFGTMAMGVYAKRPFAVAPYMGENAFIAFTVVKVMGYSWQTALGAIFISGILFIIVTALGVRSWLVSTIPDNMKRAFVAGIGLFLTFIGLNTTGIITLGAPGAPVHIGNFASPSTLLAIVGFFLIVLLMVWKVRGAILFGILGITVLSWLFGVSTVPEEVFSLPPSLEPTFLKIDFAGAFTWGFFSVLLTVFVMDFVDTMGTLIGVSYRAGFLDEHGNLPDIEKPMMVDAVATTVAALLGTTTTGVFIESATGIEAGGRTGLTAVATAFLFLLALFCVPLVIAIPACAYGPSLIIVGMLMLPSIKDIELDEISEAVPAFLIIILMSFSCNIGLGMVAGFAAYPIMKLATGKAREVSAGMWIISVISVLFFFFYPY